MFVDSVSDIVRDGLAGQMEDMLRSCERCDKVADAEHDEHFQHMRPETLIKINSMLCDSKSTGATAVASLHHLAGFTFHFPIV